jgi:mono/diheme cytochrome c family protein
MPTPSTLRGALLACALLIACADGTNGTDGTTDDLALGSSDSDAVWDPDERLAGCGDPTTGPRGRADCGDLIFEDHCALCHGAFGTGSGIGSDLTVVVKERTDEQILTALAEGFEGEDAEMPPAVVPSPGYAHLLAYLRQEFGEFRR